MGAGRKSRQCLPAILFYPATYRAYLLFFAILICLFSPSAASAQQSQTTVTSTGAIPANQSCATGSVLTRNFIVGLGGSITDVDFGVLINHSSRNNLRIRLRSPNGTEAILFQNNAELGSYANLNALFDDDAFDNQNFYSEDPAPLTPTPPPYHIALHPSNDDLSIFNGEEASGIWQMEICDPESFGVSGSFLRADLFITRSSGSADLSVTNAFNDPTPLNGDDVFYVITVNNSASSVSTADNVIIRNIFPAQLSYRGSSGFGTYNEITGEWAVGSMPPGVTRMITIMGRVTAPAGRLIISYAQVQNSSVPDPDSTPNNDSNGEDDDAFAYASVATIPGTPPNLISQTCTPARVGTQLLDWDVNNWPSGASNYQPNIPKIGTINFDLVTSRSLSMPVQVNNINTGGLSGESSLFLGFNTNNAINLSTATVTMTLPVAVPGLQFSLFDVDGLPDGDDDPSTHQIDRITVTGFFNGNPVLPILTNGMTNLVSGNIVEGIILSDPISDMGNAVVTFDQPVDQVIIMFDQLLGLAPIRTVMESISLHDILFCEPVANINVRKTSIVLSDGINATNPKAIPGSIIQYCLSIENQGSATATNIRADDPLPSQITYVPGSLRSGADCNNLTQTEDDDFNDAGESDGITAGYDRGNIAVTIDSMPADISRSIGFNIRVND